ncbi:MAG: NUDIX domain-containing protein [Patescibacteria group bacterium]|nr:NUDIX domain-containing protein [Patescibacteria group bacterium]
MITRKQFPQFLAPYCIAFEKSIGAVVFRIVDDNVEFLLMKYRNGHWEFPRGKVENNESEHETMRREIEEETSISQIKIIEDFRETMRFSYKAHGHERIDRIKDKNCIYIHKQVVFYLAQSLDKNVIISHEHQQFQWLSFDDAINRLTFKNARSILEKANQKLEKKYK